MTSSEIRNSFLDFFREKGHTIVPSSPLLPDAPNLLFTNAGMNQFVPIFLGQAPCPYKPARAADTQKCIRAGGKHNDLEDVGFDTYHHTFFEMLGNWSFGDYFKKEAIQWAWELVVERWKFPASRLYATVYQPGEGDPAGFDREAHDQWAAIFKKAGLDPAVHIINGNKKDNFWMMGDTGPCGPCSEMHVDLTPGPRDLNAARQRAGRELVNKDDARCIEIWNLVFIQFNANPDGTFSELPAKHVDTGMGFERVVSMIQGTRGLTDFSASDKISNYETDVFRPIFDELEKITGKKYRSTLPASAQNETEEQKVDVAFRVIADHVRTLSFSIADGIQPSNEGRGYVLRRILRRAVRYGRNLGLRDPFLGKLVDVLGKTMGHIFPEVVKQAGIIRATLKNEEESFFRTLEKGIELFEAVFTIQGFNKPFKPSPIKDGVIVVEDFSAAGMPFPGEHAFKLYDTYGFPLDLTELMARERGMTVDIAEFNRLMEEQKERGRTAQNTSVVKVARNSDYDGGTKFIYDAYEVETVIRGISGNRVSPSTLETPTLIPEATSLYPAMGGQIGDTGTADITLDNGKTLSVSIKSVERIATGAIFHDLDQPITGVSGLETIRIKVDQPRRARIEAHHSGTHIMHWALRKVLGNTVTQRGSYVGPDRLRFDFSHGTHLTPAELAKVENLVNEKIAEDVRVGWENRTYAEVKGDPTILQFFGDKYGEEVRVVSIGDFSKELCGGTHVKHSGQIGYFKILHESAIAAGVRRIEAASGEALRSHLEELLRKQDEQLARASVVAAAVPAAVSSSAKVGPTAARDSGGYHGDASENRSLSELWQHYKEREKLLHDMAAQRAQHEKDEAKRQEAAFQKRAAETAGDLIGAALNINGIPVLAVHVEGAPTAYLPFLADALKTRWQGVAVLAASNQGKVALLAAVSPAFTKKVQAGKIIQAIAPLVGGKGGGRPELAQGGGTNPAGIVAALTKAEETIRAMIN